MSRLLHIVLCVTAIAGCDRKLGIAGATCTASADCAADLQCVASTCVDPAVLAAARAADEAERARQEALTAQQTAEMARLMAELNDLQAEQAALVKQKQELDSRLDLVIDETEKQRLLAEQAALAEREARGKKPLRTPAQPSTADPLQGL